MLRLCLCRTSFDILPLPTIEGMWTGVRNFLRPFRGVHKRYLSQYVAMCEFSINRKRVTPKFISSIVALH
jgi:transposase-like protein